MGGGGLDWVTETLGLNYSYALELRPSETHPEHTFIIPNDQIIPVGKETLAGILAAVDAINKNYDNMHSSGIKLKNLFYFLFFGLFLIKL